MSGDRKYCVRMEEYPLFDTLLGMRSESLEQGSQLSPKDRIGKSLTLTVEQCRSVIEISDRAVASLTEETR